MIGPVGQNVCEPVKMTSVEVPRKLQRILSGNGQIQFWMHHACRHNKLLNARSILERHCFSFLAQLKTTCKYAETNSSHTNPTVSGHPFGNQGQMSSLADTLPSKANTCDFSQSN